MMFNTKIEYWNEDDVYGYRVFIEVNHQWTTVGEVMSYAECLDLERSLHQRIEQLQAA